MRFGFALAFFLLLSCSVFAQAKSGAERQLKRSTLQDSLVSLSKKFVNHELEPERYNANYQFIKTLVSALKEPRSFDLSFDSLSAISIQTSPDKQFRIFSWHIMNDDGSYRFYGSIQLNTADGKLKLFPLLDNTALIKHPEDTTCTPDTWYGAQYYQIIPVNTSSKQVYYTLLGWKGSSSKSTKKVIDILYFKDGNAYFGLPVFTGKTHDQEEKRIVFEYSRQVSMHLNFIPDQQKIVFDHLVPMDTKSKEDFSKYVPDMTFDGFQLSNGLWKFQENLTLNNVPSKMDEYYNDPKKLTNNPSIKKNNSSK